MIPHALAPFVHPWLICREDEPDGPAHRWNISASYEQARHHTLVAKVRRSEDDDRDRGYYPHPIWVHWSIAAEAEERSFYEHVHLSNYERRWVHYVVARARAGISYREIVDRLDGRIGRRQTRRALNSLVGLKLVRFESRTSPAGKRHYRAFIAEPGPAIPDLRPDRA
jgi:hypothetical protein